MYIYVYMFVRCTGTIETREENVTKDPKKIKRTRRCGSKTVSVVPTEGPVRGVVQSVVRHVVGYKSEN